jgi:hypothetical protein
MYIYQSNLCRMCCYSVTRCSPAFFEIVVEVMKMSKKGRQNRNKYIGMWKWESDFSLLIHTAKKMDCNSVQCESIRRRHMVLWFHITIIFFEEGGKNKIQRTAQWNWKQLPISNVTLGWIPHLSVIQSITWVHLGKVGTHFLLNAYNHSHLTEQTSLLPFKYQCICCIFPSKFLDRIKFYLIWPFQNTSRYFLLLFSLSWGLKRGPYMPDKHSISQTTTLYLWCYIVFVI